MKLDYPSLNFCLFNSVNSQLVEGLAWEQFRSIIRTIDKKEHGNWYYWHEKIPGWLKLEKILDDVMKTGEPRVRIAPLPPAMPKDLDLSGVTTIDVNKDKIELRTTRRFNKDIKLTVIIGTEHIETETVNISIGGAKLKTKLPHNVSSSFRVMVHTETQGIELEAVVIDNSDFGARIRFIPTENLEELRDYLLGIKKEQY